jgi:glutamine amidotransferase
MNPEPRIVVVDYGAGNVQSVVNALDALGVPALLTYDAAAIRDADGVIVPGVGAAQDTITNLERRGLVVAIREIISRDIPYLGICMGMQALLTLSDENGGQRCLDVIPGTGRRFETMQPVPHMGWNQVNRTPAGAHHPIFDDIPDGADFYFVHSYYCVPDDPSVVLAETDYDGSFACVIGRDNLIATQFHPEKSGAYGLRLLANFARIVAAGGVAQSSVVVV